MANALSGNKYNPEFFAAESLIQLEKALGLANRVHRGYERERNSFGRGDTITITRPSTFTAQTHVPGTGTTTQDIDTSKVQIVLDQWKEVKFQVRDDELAYGTEAIITDHIRPAAYALADAIDQSLMDLHIELGYATDVNTTVDVAEIYTLAKKDLRDRAVPMDPDMMSLMIDTQLEADFLQSGIFHEAQITGGSNNEDALLRGTLGRRFGFETFVNQNSGAAFTSGTVVNGGDAAGAVDEAGDATKGATSFVVDAFTGSETVLIGDTFNIVGLTDNNGVLLRFALTANTTMSTGTGTLTFTPALPALVLDNAVVTFETAAAQLHADSYFANLAFHRNWAALAMAPLPDTGSGRGAQIFSIQDPVTGLSLRARMWYDGDLATNLVALDALWGRSVLDSKLVSKVRRNQ